MANEPHVLMCPPEHYGIEYEINAWMDRQCPCDFELASQQWRLLRGLLEDLGASVSCLTPVRGLPDMVFTANAALIHHDKAILSRFRHAERQGEERHFAQWFSESGFQVERLHAPAFFEGAGDALFCGDTLFAGYRIRSDIRALQELAVNLGCRVIPLELVRQHFYHLDTCFCPLATGLAIYYPGALDDYGRRVLEAHIPGLIAVNDAEAQQFACNAVVVGRSVVTNTGCPDLHRQLREHGFTPHETPLSEFVKAGGSAKCLTLRLDGEDAAGWKSGGLGQSGEGVKFPTGQAVCLS
jgi:N-dimethylarginine dimethylaminohydrolase